MLYLYHKNNPLLNKRTVFFAPPPNGPDVSGGLETSSEKPEMSKDHLNKEVDRILSSAEETVNGVIRASVKGFGTLPTELEDVKLSDFNDKGEVVNPKVKKGLESDQILMNDACKEALKGYVAKAKSLQKAQRNRAAVEKAVADLLAQGKVAVGSLAEKGKGDPGVTFSNPDLDEQTYALEEETPKPVAPAKTAAAPKTAPEIISPTDAPEKALTQVVQKDFIWGHNNGRFARAKEDLNFSDDLIKQLKAFCRSGKSMTKSLDLTGLGAKTKDGDPVTPQTVEVVFTPSKDRRFVQIDYSAVVNSAVGGREMVSGLLNIALDSNAIEEGAEPSYVEKDKTVIEKTHETNLAEYDKQIQALMGPDSHPGTAVEFEQRIQRTNVTTGRTTEVMVKTRITKLHEADGAPAQYKKETKTMVVGRDQDYPAQWTQAGYVVPEKGKTYADAFGQMGRTEGGTVEPSVLAYMNARPAMVDTIDNIAKARELFTYPCNQLPGDLAIATGKLPMAVSPEMKAAAEKKVAGYTKTIDNLISRFGLRDPAIREMLAKAGYKQPGKNGEDYKKWKTEGEVRLALGENPPKTYNLETA